MSQLKSTSKAQTGVGDTQATMRTNVSKVRPGGRKKIKEENRCSKTLTAMVTPKEYELAEKDYEQVKGSGVKFSSYLRNVIVSAITNGKVKTSVVKKITGSNSMEGKLSELIIHLKGYNSNLRSIGVNLNQVVKRANTIEHADRLRHELKTIIDLRSEVYENLAKIEQVKAELSDVLFNLFENDRSN